MLYCIVYIKLIYQVRTYTAVCMAVFNKHCLCVINYCVYRTAFLVQKETEFHIRSIIVYLNIYVCICIFADI